MRRSTHCGEECRLKRDRRAQSGVARGRWVLVCDPPDRAVAVLRNEERTVMRDGEPNGPSPHLLVADDKPGDEVLIFASGHTIPKTDANDLVAGAFGPVPGAVLGCKTITDIVGRERIALVECQPKRRRVRLDQDIGNGDFSL